MHTRTDTDLKSILERMDARLDRLFDHVIAVSDNEKTDTAHGYLVGKQSDGRPVLWLYGHDKLKFKLATVWSEQFDALPFAVDASTPFSVSMAPKLDDALMSGQFVKFTDPIEFVKVSDGRTDDKGNLIFKFSHFVGSEPQPAATGAGGVDVSAIRAAAVAADRMSDFCGYAILMYDDIFEDATAVLNFCDYITPDTVRDPDRGALLTALAAYAARMAAGTTKRIAADAAKRVYKAMPPQAS